MMRWFWIVSVLALFFACGGKERPNQITPMSTGGRPGPAATGGRSGGGSAGSDAGVGPDTAMGGSGAEGGAPEFDPLAPVVEITSPTAVSDPDDGEVLIKDNVIVLCRASKSSASGSVAVDPSTVKIAMIDAAGRPLEVNGAATANDGEFSANFVLTPLANGVVSFRCTAGDVASPRHIGSTRISTFVDRGPTIRVAKPLAAAILALKTAAAFEFTVEAAPLADGDAGAAIGQVTLSVLGLPIADLAPAPMRPGVYITTVDFNNPMLFPETPSGDIPVVITASNRRSPTAAVRTETYAFTLDGEGPVVTITKPKANAVVGPDQQLLEFKVSDTPAGVVKNSVTVTLNGKAYGYEALPSPWTEKSGTFTFKFDSSMLNGAVAAATINVHATDQAGNEADGDSLIVYLDDFPPIVSLDPGMVRVVVRPPMENVKPKCSIAFDPLGRRAVSDDGKPLGDFATFRALVWDESNEGTGQPTVRLSGANPDSVYLYLQPDPEQPLVIDSSGRGRCDTVTTQDVNGKDLEFIHLAPVKPDGTAPNAPDDRTPDLVKYCDLNGGSNAYLCGSDMTYVMRHTIATGTEPVIYALAPGSDVLSCTGNAWEIRSLVGHAGWACLAAVASDKGGNHGISRPLRICIDDDDDPNTSPCDGVDPPTCTDGCDLPAAFAYTDLEYLP